MCPSLLPRRSIWSRTRFLSNVLSGNSPQTYHGYIWVAKFLFQQSNIIIIIEDTDRKETSSRALAISNLDDATLFFSRTEKKSLLDLAASQSVRNPMKHNLFSVSSFYKRLRGLLRELRGLYQEWDTARGFSFPTLLCTAPSANETTTASMKNFCSIPCVFLSKTLATN